MVIRWWDLVVIMCGEVGGGNEEAITFLNKGQLRVIRGQSSIRPPLRR